ncbi:MAG TPA: sigma-54-dependent Fis family transcriptional regulator [Desulfobacteraceae bacterium]|nr:sigma-54-dependent Fis family transcriptional regulator [Desulfobacteraceae bacterium]
MKLLIIDDDLRQRELLLEVFAGRGYRVTACGDGREGLLLLQSEKFDTVITDLKMPHIGGEEILKAALLIDPDLPVIVITGYGSIESAIEAMKAGAHDYIQKPFDPEELVIAVQKAQEHYGLIKKNRELAAQLATIKADELIGASRVMQEVKGMISRAAPLDVTVLISGETGTGKELAARLIHRSSRRSEGRFLAVNCGALHETLLESELFGHEKGAFTGADRQKAGLLEAADNGTLFLDEINSMPPSLQIKLLRVLQEGSFLRVGATRETGCDIRIISATNADLKTEVDAGRFREDLYYRLHVMNIHLPPLRQRREDIPELCYHFLSRYNARYDKEIKTISNRALKLLCRFPWPGNVRELENIISRAVIMEESDSLSENALPVEIKKPEQAQAVHDLPLMRLAEMEQFMIKKALIATGNNKAQAAQLLGIDTSTLWRKMKKT